MWGGPRFFVVEQVCKVLDAMSLPSCIKLHEMYIQSATSRRTFNDPWFGTEVDVLPNDLSAASAC